MKKKEIIDVNVERISLVDKAANKRKYVMLKANKEGDKMTLVEMVKTGLITQEDADFLMKKEDGEVMDSEIIAQMKSLITSLATTIVNQKNDGIAIKDELLKAVKEQITASVEAIKKEEEAIAANDKPAEDDKPLDNSKPAEDKEPTVEQVAEKEAIEKMKTQVDSIKKAETMDAIMSTVKEIRGEDDNADVKVVESLNKKIKDLEKEIMKMKKTSDQVKGPEKQEKSAKEVTFAGIFN